jgi:nucleotide-binding universal stress UspA family protein
MMIVLLSLLGVWLLSGLGAAFVMGRRGYDPWSWGVYGALFGPAVVPLAIGWHRRHGSAHDERVQHVGTAGPGPIAVLVGIDGSTEALVATDAAVGLLGDRLASLTLATVVDFDQAAAMHQPRGEVFEQCAQSLLDAAATRVVGAYPTTVVLIGRPADALVGYAKRHDIDLIAIGARGRGLSETIVGSVAEQLVRAPDVLVLIAGRVATATRQETPV